MAGSARSARESFWVADISGIFFWRIAYRHPSYIVMAPTLQRLQEPQPMIRSRYVILEPDKPLFLTCTVAEWLPVLTRPDAVQPILECWIHLRQHHGLQLYDSVILENRLHFVARAPRLGKCLNNFKSWTAARLIE